MRILHTSDWHFGLNLNNVSLLEDQKAFVVELVRIAQAESVEAIIIAGDIFDHAVSGPEAIQLYGKAMTGLCRDSSIPVLICAGNHDGAARLSSCSELLSKTGLFIAGRIQSEMKPVEIGDAAFHLLPYFVAEEVRSLFPEAEIGNYGEAMTFMTKFLAEKKVADKRNILVAHCFVGGALVSESDRSAMVGGSNIVPREVFDDFDYVALGHLHRPQNMSDKVRYSGSPLKYSFSEATHIKSVTIIDTADISIKEVAVKPLREMRSIRGTYEEVLAMAELDPNTGDYMKIELTDTYAGLEKLDVFRSIYPNLLSMIGKALEAENQTVTLTLDELSDLSPKDILIRFYAEIAGAEIDAELEAWFDKALVSLEKGGVDQ